MKKSRILIFGAAFFCTAAMLLSGCGNAAKTAEAEQSETVTISETTAASVTRAEKKKTEAPKKEIKPLSPNRRQAYLQNDDFSVTAELLTLEPSLYYPDIVHDFGANPDLFVITAAVKAKNMTEEDKVFDEAKLSLSDMFYCGGDTEEFKEIKSGKSAVGELRFLCSLEQAAAINGILYDGEYFDEGEDFYPEEFGNIIETQSADDIGEYLYRQFYIHGRQSGYFWLDTEPSSCELHHIKAVEMDGKNYLSVSYTFYNRSDYAQLIEPSAYVMLCGRDTEKAEDYNMLSPIEPLYISTDKKLMYEPQEVELSIKGAGQLYEIPEYICMTPENPTDFTLIYDFRDYLTVIGISFRSSHKDEPYYSKLGQFSEYGYGTFNWNAWEEDFIGS